MYAKYQNGVFTELVGNVIFSPTVYQTPESLTDAQRAEFDVHLIVDIQPELPVNHVWSGQWVYEVDGANIHRHWIPVAMTAEQIEARRKASIPQSVTMRQARLALHAAGLLTSVNAAIAAMPEPDRTAAQITWEFAATVDRGFGMVPQLAAALGMTETQIDDLFIAAAQL